MTNKVIKISKKKIRAISNKPYGGSKNIRCQNKECWYGSVKFDFNNLQYMDESECDRCAAIHVITKPEPIIYYTDTAVVCPECQELPCSCGYYVYAHVPRFMNIGDMFGDGKTILSLSSIYIENSDRTSIKTTSSWDTYLRHRNIAKIKDDKTKSLSNIQSSIQMNFLRSNEIMSRIDTYTTKILRSMMINRHPPFKKKTDRFNINWNGSTISFNIDKRTLDLKDEYCSYSFYIHDDLSIDMTNIKEYWNGDINSRRYGRIVPTYASRITSFLNIYTDITGISSFKNEVDMEKVTGNFRWNNISFKNFDDINTFKAGLIVKRFGDWNCGATPRTTSQILSCRYIDEFGYGKTDFLLDNSWTINDYIKTAFAHNKYNDKLYEKFKNLLENRQTLIDYATSRKERLSKGNTITSFEKTVRKHYEEKIVEHVVNLNKSKCLFCGGSIHNPRAFTNIKSVELYEKFKDSVGAVCCGCYYKLDREGHFAEHKKIVEELLRDSK